jgi:Chaperone of endosialidase
MNPLIQRTTIPPLLITVLLSCFGLMSRVQAVVPPPDGCYPNYTTAEGCNALNFLTTGAGNSGLGWYSLYFNSTGSFNTGVGGGALALNNADSNTAVGAAALLLNTAGHDNTAVGTDALLYNDSGDFNTAGGSEVLFGNTTGSQNTAYGFAALFGNTTGTANTAVGFGALQNNTSGGYNIAIGALSAANVITADGVICIGSAGADVNNSCYIANIYSNVQPIVGTNPDSVTITSNGRLGRGNVSSRRYKHDIKAMDKASEGIYALKPVSFRYNKQYDVTQTLAFGLIAEEVAEVYPDLVGRNPEGQPESVRYEQINAMLLNEFLKEHRKVEDLRKDFQATVAQQQKEIASLAATVKEQAAQIQKVSAQLEASKPAPQMVNNP